MLPPSSIVTTTLLFAGLSAAAAAQSPRSFSLDVEKKSSGSQHDFIRAWAAVHQKWGKGVSSEVYSMLSPGDDGDGKTLLFPFLIYSQKKITDRIENL